MRSTFPLFIICTRNVTGECYTFVKMFINWRITLLFQKITTIAKLTWIRTTPDVKTLGATVVCLSRLWSCPGWCRLVCWLVTCHAFSLPAHWTCGNASMMASDDVVVKRVALCSTIFAGFAYVGYSILKSAFCTRGHGRDDKEKGEWQQQLNAPGARGNAERCGEASQ